MRRHVCIAATGHHSTKQCMCSAVLCSTISHQLSSSFSSLSVTLSGVTQPFIQHRRLGQLGRQASLLASPHQPATSYQSQRPFIQTRPASCSTNASNQQRKQATKLYLCVLCGAWLRFQFLQVLNKLCTTYITKACRGPHLPWNTH